MATDSESDNIPMLDELLASGDTPPASKQHGNQSTGPDSRTDKATNHSNDILEAPEQTNKSAFEATVEAMITEIMNRHMAKAREEIARTLLAEIRARLRKQQCESSSPDE